MDEADLKFVLSVDPDEDALNKAIQQINADIDSANVRKIKMGLQQEAAEPLRALEPSFLEKKFGNFGTKMDEMIGKTRLGQIWQGMSGGGGGGADMSGVEGAIVGGAEGGGAGAAAGAAAGGPLAIAAVAVVELAKAAGKLAAVPLKLVSSGFETVGLALRGMQGPLGVVGAGLDVASKMLQGISDIVKKIPVVGDILGPIMDVVAAFPAIIKDITESLVGMTEKASPGVYKQFTLALEDAQATIGEAFIPLVELLTDVVREFSDFLANVLPDASEMAQLLAPLREEFNQLITVLKFFGPEMKMVVVEGLRFLINSLRELAMFAKIAAATLGLILMPLRAFGSEQDYNYTGTKKATVAARQPFMGGIEEYQRRLQLETARGPRGKMDTPQNVANIAQSVANIDRWFTTATEQWIVNLISLGIQGLLQGSTMGIVAGAEAMGGGAAAAATGGYTGGGGGGGNVGSGGAMNAFLGGLRGAFGI